MKKSLLGLAVSALFAVGVAHAETNANDVSATLSVTGTVVQDITQVCTVTLDKSAVSLNSDVDNLVNQGDNATTANVQLVNLSITGGNQCQDQVTAGKMAYKFIGTNDNADGTVLANLDASEAGAQGVGVGIFDSAMKPLRVNQDTMAATTGNDSIALELVKLNGKTAVAGNVLGSVTIQIERL